MSHPAGRGSRPFTCLRCRFAIDPNSYGTRHRNHCPRCLWSRHVDHEPGDRRCPCRSAMEPIGVEVRGGGEWALVHRCTGCGTLKTNRVAGDDHELALLQLALRPLANPPFPLDRLIG